MEASNGGTKERRNVGTEKWKRRNASGVIINRSPESRAHPFTMQSNGKRVAFVRSLAQCFG